jgi:Domain of unknown function (DUF4907)
MLFSLLSLKAIEEINAIKCIYSIKTYRVKNGWGLKVYKRSKRFIKQKFMPPVENKIPFRTKNAAIKMAKFIIDEDRTKNY